MEMGSVVEFFENKSVLVTGSTGFIGKIFVEKILRVQPNVKKLYLLVRAPDAEAATLRFHDEVVAKELFKVLKEKWGTRLSSYISEKVTFVPGDISSEDFGIKDSNLKDKLWDELDIIVNSAATTKFDERYDVAFGINTLGAKHLVDFAKKCVKLQVFVHVSTAFVCGESTGLVLERLLDNPPSGLNVDAEMRVIEKKINELKTKGASQNEITVSMKSLGIERAKLHGWPNTYAFTKAMGEMLMQRSKENVSVVTVRPTIVTSTYKDPFPGWNDDDLRTINSIIAGSAQGNLRCLLGETDTVLDAIPADMVVNAMIVALVAHAKQPSSGVGVYHVASSLKNPVTIGGIVDYGVVYFKRKPWINKHGAAIRVSTVRFFSSLGCFHFYMKIRYWLPLKIIQVANRLFRNHFQDLYKDLTRKAKFTALLAGFYQPFLSNKRIFDDRNTETLRMAAMENQAEADLFCFDPESIDWGDYFMNTHIPSIDRTIQPKKTFPPTTKAYGGKHLPVDKTIAATVTFSRTSRRRITHFPVSRGESLGNGIGATPVCLSKSVLGVYAL